MAECISIIILSISVLVYLVIKKHKENTKEKELKEVVAWCASSNSNTFRDNIHLWEYLSNAQIKLNLPHEYCISTDDWELTKEILQAFQNDVTQRFFINQISLPSSKYVISHETYFMYLLQDYCARHQCDYEFLGHNMHKETIEYKSYGSWGAALYDAIYSLTDFAIVVHKIYYISYMYCKNSSSLNPNGERWLNEHLIENVIHSRQLSVSRV